MYLKAIEIQGFKSFPDRTVLTFGSDITAIVGPNGSGKSNISDAIRWVMGEMSTKALRGSKMEDVIFGGTVKRKQLGFAEVSLILDNTEHLYDVESTEVMVTRRYYRSGDSEYYINRQSARLKDINEMFMDTGLGKEGYCNIGQGRIDEILSAKSTDRREIFEEAAGISKYRHRKEETERKLQQTADNLLRINDKISELELQVVPLREQAEKAKKYLVLREELRGLEIAVWMQQLEKLAATAKKAEEDYNSAKFILEQGRSDLEELYRRAERLTQSMQKLDVEAEQLRTAITAAENTRADRTSEAAVLRTKMQGNEANIRRLQQEMTAQSARGTDLETQLKTRVLRLDEIAQELKTLDAELQEQRGAERLAGAALESQNLILTQKRSALQDQQSHQAEYRTGISANEQSIRNLNERLETVKKNQAESQKKQQQLASQRTQLENRLSAAQAEAENQKNSIRGYEMRSQSRSRKRTELQDEASQLKIRRDTLDSRIRMYQEMERDYEGYSKATRIVMQERDRGNLRGVHGPVSALLRTDDDYTVAIETALGASAGSVVVDNEQDGKACITLLRRRDGGRATFLPLSTIRGRRLQENGLSEERGFEGLAVDLVAFDPVYRNIMENLLGRTVIAENMDTAIAIANRHGHRFRIVTLDGQVLNAGGSMTGGSTAKSSGVLTRANELTRMQQERESVQQKLQTANTALQAAVRAAAQSDAETEHARTLLRETEDTILQLTQQRSGLDALRQTYEEATAAADRECSVVEQLLSGGTDQTDVLRTELQAGEAKVQLLQREVGDAELAQQRLTEETAHISDTIHEIERKQAALEAERTATEERGEELRKLIGQLSGDSATRKASIRQYEEENRQLQEEIELKNQAAQVQQEKADGLREKLQDTLSRRMALEKQKNQNEKDAQQKNRDILDMEKECLRLEQKKAAADLEEKQILDKLWDNYELTHETASGMAAEIESITSAQRRIAELKRKINALGHINPGAIEEYARVSERYEYLTGQRDDVETSRRELQKLIGDITGEMTGIFTEEFGKINTYFGQTFTEMFGGGKASLILEDEHDVLSCGIEIKVQPPGKQVKSITLLSGGEKAFVAIALYFAIMRVRPTPFCMLDEIDAALDDQNVARFASYLHNLSTRTQFIVITHRRGTMEASDVLYGVTMQEQGVSKVLSVDLNQVVKELNIH